MGRQATQRAEPSYGDLLVRSASPRTFAGAARKVWRVMFQFSWSS